MEVERSVSAVSRGASSSTTSSSDEDARRDPRKRDGEITLLIVVGVRFRFTPLALCRRSTSSKNREEEGVGGGKASAKFSPVVPRASATG